MSAAAVDNASGKPESSGLASRYSYQRRYIQDVDSFLDAVKSKTLVPHQLEVQPGRLKGDSLCWMKCPYCYGGSSENTGERLPPERLIEILEQTASGPHGGVPKLVFAGYATDPLNYEHIDDLVDTAFRNGQIIGMHTKALTVSDRLIGILGNPDVTPMSYLSVSLDAGRPESYNAVHGLDTTRDLYSRILGNLSRLAAARDASGAELDLSATYLVTRRNQTSEEVAKAIEDVRATGIDLLRFSFPQVPRGMEDEQGSILPNRKQTEEACERLRPLVEAADGNGLRVLIADYDAELGVSEARSMPCVARFVFPSIGFDGFLAHCSESAAPHFRDMTLGDLRSRDFWDVYYDYDAESLWQYLAVDWQRMQDNDCRCDRKEHAVNLLIQDALGERPPS